MFKDTNIFLYLGGGYQIEISIPTTGRAGIHVEASNYR